MGLWWKKSEAAPPKDKEKFVTFAADPEALSKRWWMLWRYCQNWHIIRVKASIKPYKLYFRSATGQTMVYRWRIFADCVAVRVGTEDVTFWATHGTGTNPTVTKTGLIIPGLFRKDRRDMRHKEDAEYYASVSQFV